VFFLSLRLAVPVATATVILHAHKPIYGRAAFLISRAAKKIKPRKKFGKEFFEKTL
jgi:hypothetical protein